MAGTMRAEAPSFTPGASPELKATAFQLPPGLGLDVTSADVQGQKTSGWSASPVSTAAPSPAMTAVSGTSSSPWASPFFGSSNSRKNSWEPPFSGFALPEASEPAAAEAEEFEFKLQGVEDLQKSVASLLAGLTLPPMGSGTPSSADGGAADTSSTSAGNTTEEEDSPPSTPTILEGATDVPSTPASDGHEDLFAEEDAIHQIDLPLKSEEEKEEEGEPADVQVTSEVAVEDPAPQVRAAPWAKAWQNRAEPDPLPARCKAAAGATTDSAALDSDTPLATTVMLKNVPRSYTREILVKRLEEAGFEGNFDFVYLPADFGKSGGRGGRACLAAGHAVVNFRSKEACERFEKTFHKVSAKKAFPGTGGGAKVCEVSLAPMQGKDANVKKLQNSGLLMSLLAERQEWLPLLFDEEGAPELFSTDPLPN